LILSRKFPGDGYTTSFLARAVLADRPRILAAVPRIDGDDEIAGIGRRVFHLDGLICARGDAKIDDQPVAVVRIGRGQKAFGFEWGAPDRARAAGFPPHCATCAPA